jgi:histidine triad (HIT) family protein
VWWGRGWKAGLAGAGKKPQSEGKGFARPDNSRYRLAVFHAHLVEEKSSAVEMAEEKLAAMEAAVAKAKEAAESGAPTLFDKIVSKQIPSTVVYEDDKVLAFRDISPQAPVHIIIVPKDRDGLTQLSKAEERHTEILGHLMVTAAVVAKQEGLVDGFRLVVNDGPQGCQSVYHLHLHLLGGRQMNWPPG